MEDICLKEIMAVTSKNHNKGHEMLGAEIIRLQHVSFSYGDHQVLRDVNLTIHQGETHVILGGSGSGKTTILKIILGLLQPDEGYVFVEGEEISRLKEKELRRVRQKMGVVFQEGALFDSLTVGENVAYGLKEHNRLAPEQIEERMLEVLQMVELQGSQDMMPDELSGGMRRRVGIARALAYWPKILLYDEPTTGLDPIVCETICCLLMKLRDLEGVTSVLVTHDMATALMIADRFAVLKDGGILFDGDKEDLLNSRQSYVKKFMTSMSGNHHE